MALFAIEQFRTTARTLKEKYYKLSDAEKAHTA